MSTVGHSWEDVYVNMSVSLEDTQEIRTSDEEIPALEEEMPSEILVQAMFMNRIQSYHFTQFASMMEERMKDPDFAFEQGKQAYMGEEFSVGNGIPFIYGTLFAIEDERALEKPSLPEENEVTAYS